MLEIKSLMRMLYHLLQMDERHVTARGYLVNALSFNEIERKQQITNLTFLPSLPPFETNFEILSTFSPSNYCKFLGVHFAWVQT
jgi:hypothetical protein